MKTLIFFILISYSLSSLAESTWLRKRPYYVYSYIYKGEIIKEFDGRNSTPMFYAKCAINLINQSSDEEGRYFTSEKVELYCGKKPVQIFTDSKIANYFSSTKIESEDKTWAVFAAENDSAVPGFVLLKSDGTVTSFDISEYWFMQGTIETRVKLNQVKITPDIIVNKHQIIISGYAKDTSIPNNNKREKAKLIISSDGTYQLKF